MNPGSSWRTWRESRGFWLALLLLVAAVYFGSYYRYSLNFRDEGGTEGLIAQRLLAGERPFRDVVLGYNVLWFYPILGLFKLCGVNFVALRVYCFALSTLTAAIGFFTVTRAGRRPWLGFLVGLMLVLVPGMTFKNYMPFLAVTNSACLLQFALAPPEKRWRWVVIGGLVLGMTFLIRIDVGLFVTALWLGGIVLRMLSREISGRGALGFIIPAVAAMTALVLALHLPVYLDAKNRGFDRPFVEQYANWPRSFVEQVRQRLSSPAPAPAVASPSEEVPAASAPPAPAGTPAAPVVVPPRDTLHRKTLGDSLHSHHPDERNLILLLYAPLISLGLLVFWATLRLGRMWVQREEAAYAGALGSLLLLGGALTDFPQYFFFRPDAPHLSEFSPGLWVATVGSLLLLATTAPRKTRWRPWIVSLFACFLAAHAGLYLWRMLPDRFTGTIAARRNRKVLFHGENGVNVFVSRHESEGLRLIRQIIRDHTQRDDYLVAYPYHPMLNLLADRRTYERNVYVDNAIAEPNWNAAAIARLERFRPAVVILSDWEINGTPASRFSVWAAPTRQWIQEHYTLQGTHLNFEIYTRPDAPKSLPGTGTPATPTP